MRTSKAGLLGLLAASVALDVPMREREPRKPRTKKRDVTARANKRRWRMRACADHSKDDEP